ncbi:unnamed protein product, partial [Polarella glacialis]
ATVGEAALAQEESNLLEERNLVEVEFQGAQLQREEAEQEALSTHWEFEDCGRQLDEAEREQWALSADQRLLEEIEAQVEPIRRRLAEREHGLQEEEEELRACEADCDEREARTLPEYQHSVQSLLAAESRQRELQSREEESSEQQQRLLQRQRHFGGEEIRLSGIEGALQRQSSLLGGTASSLTESIEDMRRKLARLRGSESDWAERERLQQLEVQLLEAQLLREPRADLEAACVLMS